MEKTAKKKGSVFNGFLNAIERVGNKLPHPITLFAILAPVFVPMFMLLGYTPEYAQVAFRIGDSCTNIITPMMSFFAMIVVFVQDYDEDAGMGTLTSMMLPYCITFLIGWTLMLIAWIVFDLPVGPGVGIFLA